MSRLVYRIQCILKANQTYFQQMTSIGPMFGATKEEARVFSSKKEALKIQASHWGFIESKIVAEKRETS
jgi:hypothetical protein